MSNWQDIHVVGTAKQQPTSVVTIPLEVWFGTADKGVASAIWSIWNMDSIMKSAASVAV